MLTILFIILLCAIAVIITCGLGIIALMFLLILAGAAGCAEGGKS